MENLAVKEEPTNPEEEEEEERQITILSIHCDLERIQS